MHRHRFGPWFETRSYHTRVQKRVYARLMTFAPRSHLFVPSWGFSYPARLVARLPRTSHLFARAQVSSRTRRLHFIHRINMLRLRVGNCNTEADSQCPPEIPLARASQFRPKFVTFPKKGPTRWMRSKLLKL